MCNRNLPADVNSANRAAWLNFSISSAIKILRLLYFLTSLISFKMRCLYLKFFDIKYNHFKWRFHNNFNGCSNIKSLYFSFCYRLRFTTKPATCNPLFCWLCARELQGRTKIGYSVCNVHTRARSTLQWLKLIFITANNIIRTINNRIEIGIGIGIWANISQASQHNCIYNLISKRLRYRSSRQVVLLYYNSRVRCTN